MRTANSLKNTKFNVIAQFCNILVQFISRTIFIHILGDTLLSLNGLFTNILSLLSLAELGVGSALNFSLYKPLAQKNTKKIRQLLNTYRKTYNFISILILAIGLLIIPFLGILTSEIEIANVTIIYILYLLNTSLSYLNIYKASIINADQKNYIITLTQQVFHILANLAMLTMLVLTKSFIIYLVTQILFTVITNLYISRIADRLYPYIKNVKTEKLPRKDQKQLIHYTSSTFLHKIGATIVTGTDNILLSVMVNLGSVGIYSNYQLLIGAIKKITSMFSSSLTASVGNLGATEKPEKIHQVFQRVLYANFLITAFCSCCLLSLINPFIQIWLNTEYVFTLNITVTIILNFFIENLRMTALCFIEANGLFVKNKLKPIIESITNLILSIILTLKFGIVGIFLGTFLSMAIVCLYWEGHTLYKYCFNRHPNEYIYKIGRYIIISTIVSIAVFWLNAQLFQSTNLPTFALRTIFTTITTALLLIVLTAHQAEFRYYIKLIQRIRRKGKQG